MKFLDDTLNFSLAQRPFHHLLLNGPGWHGVLAPATIALWIDMPWCMSAHDALGCVLMGGEL